MIKNKQDNIQDYKKNDNYMHNITIDTSTSWISSSGRHPVDKYWFQMVLDKLQN